MRVASVAFTAWPSPHARRRWASFVGPQEMADASTANPAARLYLGFGTGFELGALVFFFAALAFCF
jgi:hypothetical protein